MADNALLPAPDSPFNDSIDVMNDPQYVTNSGGGEDGTGDADTCRICRGEATTQEPLFYPCKCSGSIKFVHQDCLMEWLSHSQKKHCELCKTPFRFTKLYSPNMPPNLPTHVFFQHLIIHGAKNVAIWLRACLVLFVWLGLLPWVMRHVWGLLFWFGDGGWTSTNVMSGPNTSSITEALLLAQEQFVMLTANTTSPASPILATPTTSAHVVRLLDQLPKFTFNWTSSDPLTSSFRKLVSYSLGLHGVAPGRNFTTVTKGSRINEGQLASSVKQSSLLSEVKFLKNFTRWSRFNTVVITTLEGQIITLLVVVCFVLIFLIREWVVQQQPGINMGAGFNADFAGRNGIAQPDALPIHADDPEGAADDNERIRRDVAGRAIARPRRRQVRFEEARINDPEQHLANPPDLPDVASVGLTESELNHESSSSVQRDSSFAANDDLSDTHLDAGHFVEVWRRAGGNPDEVLRIIEAENLGEKLRYWKTSLKLLRDRQTQLTNDSDTTHSDIDSVSNIGVFGSLANQSEDNSSSDSWVEIPDTIPKSAILGLSSSFLEDEKIILGSKKGKERETTEMRQTHSTDLNERGTSQHIWTAEQLSKLEDGLNNGSGLQAILGRPRAVSDGPKVQSSISQLGNDSWTFSNLPTDMTLDSKITESKSSAVSWSALKQLPIGEDPEETATGGPSSPEAIPDLQIQQSWTKNGEQDLSGTVESEPIELYNPETGEMSTAESWDEVFARNPVEGSEVRNNQIIDEETNNPFHQDQLLPEDTHLLEPRDAPVALQQENLGLFGSVADWLWGDTIPGMDIPPGDEEHIVHDLAAEAPFVPVVHNAQNMVVVEEEMIPNRDHDRELAEALAAGIDPADPDAIDDAEDFEGIMELVGMRGPLTQLFQNGLFSAVLISLTVACGVWMPYNFGRLFLLLIANPIHTIKIPLALLFSCAAILQDLGLVLLGGISYAFLWIFSLITTFSPEKLTPTPSNWSRAYEPIKIASSALDRVVELMISSLVKVTASEVPTFSAMSHEALLHIKSVLFSTIQFLSVLFTNAARSTASDMETSDLNSTLINARALALNLGRSCWQHLGELGLALSSADTWVMNLDSPHRATPIDPILSYWNGVDRFWAIIAGYVALSFVGAAYLRRSSPFSTSETGREWEATIVDILNQAGGVMKVILIISIEMLVFPLYCGLLLDLALLPLFENATIVSRILFTLETPLTSMFVHWFVGTCYMFHFALFVSMCRKIMRPGVLYFIRDPDDPTFHPVRDVLERNVATQLRKITFSAMVYGALVVVCLGGVVWSIAFAFKGVLPIHWSSNEPVLQFPIDLLFYNFFMPLAVKFFKPSDGLHNMYSWWFRKCARILRLTWFLFDKRIVDEEGRHLRQGWSRLFYSIREGFLELFRPLDVDLKQEQALNDDFLRDGKYVRTPASDQVRIPKGQQVFIEVDEDNKRIDGKSELGDASSGENYKLVYIPPSFQTRIFLFILSIWLFAAVTGVGITIVPLVFGRFVFAKIIPNHIRKNDVYAFAIGSYVLGSLLYCAIHLRGGLQYIRNALAVNENTPKMVIRRACTFTVQILRVIYAYTAFVFVLPTLLTLVMEFYFIIPLHTYFAPSESHVIHFVQSWTLGLLYVKIGTHLILWHSTSRPAEALRAVTRNGYLDPDIRIATRAFILPATVILVVALTLPICIAAGANRFDLLGAESETQRKVYRYAFPFTLSLMVHLMGVWTAIGVLRGWRMKIRDEVYLIGERLHNFGDRSKSGVNALVPTRSRIETGLGN